MMTRVGFPCQSKRYAIRLLPGLGLDRAGHGPQEAREFTGNGRTHLDFQLARAHRVLIAAAEPLLASRRSPARDRWCGLGPSLQMRRLAGREAVAPGGLGEHPPDVAVAGLRCPPRRVVAPLEDSEGTSPR